MMLIVSVLSKSKSVKFHCAILITYINQWNMHCLSVIIHWLVKVLLS